MDHFIKEKGTAGPTFLEGGRGVCWNFFFFWGGGALSWDTSREGNRFKILRIFFNSDKGLTSMYDLLHGSKVDLLEGFPHELEKVRNKTYLTLPNPRRGRFSMDC